MNLQLSILIIIIQVIAFGAFAEETPQIVVPVALKPPTIDGTISKIEWGDAAVIQCAQIYCRLSGTSASFTDYRLKSGTTFYVKYDVNNVYVAADCNEKQLGYPIAFPRKPVDDLTLDDSIQVVLGLRDDIRIRRETLNMGGYVGALGTAATSADHYYQFTVNAAGAVSRTYNENPLFDVGFEAKVSKSDHGWSVEMRIPSCSFGGELRVGNSLYANFIRYRPPHILGWYMPGFGGYYPMPFGKMFFLEEGQSHLRTQQFMVAKTPHNESRMATQASIMYAPLSGSIVGVADGAPAGATLKLDVENAGSNTKVVAVSSSDYVKMKIPAGQQPSRHASFSIIDANGSVLSQVQKNLPKVDAPEWFNTDAGIDYLDSKIPRPWTKPIIESNTVKLVNKSISFGEFGLPYSVIDKFGDLFAGQAKFVAEVKGEQLIFRTDKLVIKAVGHQVLIDANANCNIGSIQTRIAVDYDGFIEVKLRLKDIHADDLSKLALRVPLKKNCAKYIHRELVQEIKELTGFGYTANGGPIWVGSEDKGIAFNYDVNPFYSVNLRRQINVIQTDQCCWLEINFVDAAGQLPDNTIIHFFLQPTPTKPLGLAKVHPQVTWWWENWSDYQGYPDITKIPVVKKWTAELHSNNKIGLLYTCQHLAENSPDFEQFKDDLLGLPAWVCYKRAFEPGLGIPCYFCCKRGPEGDMQLWGLKKLSREAQIDGIVSDGLSVAWPCANPAHMHGCQDSVVVSWEGEDHTRTLDTRRFLKRVRGIFDETNRPFCMAAHTGGGLDISTLSFFDVYMEGEQLSRFNPGYRIPRYVFAVGYNGYPWGYRTIFWDKTWRRTRGFFWSLTYALLHDCELEDTDMTQRIYAGFNKDSETTYYPYWRENPYVKIDSKTTLMSFYLKRDAGLFVIGNLNSESDKYQINLEKIFDTNQVSVEELLSGDRSINCGAVLKGQLEGYKCVVFLIKPVRNTTKRWIENGLNPKDWQLTTGGSFDVNAIRLSAVGNEVKAVYSKHTFSGKGHVSFVVRHSGRMSINFGRARLFWDNGWNAISVPQTEVSMKLFNPPAVHERNVQLEFAFNDGWLEALYDGQPLCRYFYIGCDDIQWSLSTWYHDSIEVRPISVSNDYIPLFAPGIARDIIPMQAKEESIDLTKQLLKSWSVQDSNNGQMNDSDSVSSYKLFSKIGKPEVVAVLHGGTCGEDVRLAFKIRAINRFKISIGTVTLMHDSGWKMEGPLNGWSEGKINPVDFDPNDIHTVIISAIHGKFDVFCDDKIVVHAMQFELPVLHNQIQITTWAGDNIEFELREFSIHPSKIQVSDRNSVSL